MVNDVSQAKIEEEIVYRDGIRYVNRIRKLTPDEKTITKHESLLTEDGERKPFKLTSMSGQLVSAEDI